MAENSKIEWTDATWQPITGCSIDTPGCINCYAMRLAAGRLRHHPSRKGLTMPSKAGPVWTGEVRFNEGWIKQPLEWSKPRRVFVCAHGDLFHENVPDVWIDRVFAVMALAPQHTFQVLTKRAKRMREYIEGVVADQELGLNRFGIAALWTGLHGPAGSLPSWPLSNVWLGVSCERQKEADLRIPDLEATSAVVRFISAEPLLGRIHLKGLVDKTKWVIVGGESGPKARDMDPNWARSIKLECQICDIAFFMKQMARKAAIPDDLMVRQFPRVIE